MSWLLIVVSTVILSGVPTPVQFDIVTRYPTETQCKQALESLATSTTGPEGEATVQAKCLVDPTTYSAGPEGLPNG